MGFHPMSKDSLKKELLELLRNTTYVVGREFKLNSISLPNQNIEQEAFLNHLCGVWINFPTVKFGRSVQHWEIIAISTFAQLLKLGSGSTRKQVSLDDQLVKDGFGYSLFYYVTLFSSDQDLLKRVIPNMLLVGYDQFLSCSQHETPLSAAVMRKNYVVLDQFLPFKKENRTEDVYWKRLAQNLAREIEHWMRAGLDEGARNNCFEYALDVYEDLDQNFEDVGEFLTQVELNYENPQIFEKLDMATNVSGRMKPRNVNPKNIQVKPISTDGHQGTQIEACQQQTDYLTRGTKKKFHKPKNLSKGGRQQSKRSKCKE